MNMRIIHTATPMGGIVQMLLVTKEEMDSATLCENCGSKRCIQHETLAKEDHDWCMDCNDQAHGRTKMSNIELHNWMVAQSILGYSVMVGLDEEVKQ